MNKFSTNYCVKTSKKYIFKQSVALKHRYFLDWLLNQPDIEVCTYINKLGFSLCSGSSIMRPLRFLESRVIMAKNGLSRKVKRIAKKDISPDDIVIAYRHDPSSLSDMNSIDAFKVISLIHFHGEESDAKLIESAFPDILINESDLSEFSEIYRRYYNQNIPMLVHPFVGNARFRRIKPFKERENKCFSTGTITYKHHPEFLATYGDPCDQPSRKQILDNKDALEPIIACYNANYLEDKVQKSISKTDNRIVRFYKAWYNLTHVGHQKKYFSFDMVERFNNFKMCLIGEEILGVPGIGFVEGMCCGCAYIGINNGLYDAYGMKEGVHYIGYDGTLENLKSTIAYYQMPEHQEELERIAEAGYKFAQQHFRGANASEFLYDALMHRHKLCHNKHSQSHQN